MTTIELDVAGDCPISDVLVAIARHNGRLIDHIAVGPGGGNPCLTIEFDNQDLAESYLNDIGYDSDDIEDFIID